MTLNYVAIDHAGIRNALERIDALVSALLRTLEADYASQREEGSSLDDVFCAVEDMLEALKDAHGAVDQLAAEAGDPAALKARLATNTARLEALQALWAWREVYPDVE